MGHLQGGDHGEPWFLRVSDDEAFVAVPDVGGGGGGWFRSDQTLDPGSRNWDPADAEELFERAGDDRDQVASLTAKMIGSCLRDGFGRDALELADVVLDAGYTLEISVQPTDDQRATPALG
jgi:hypothetical protein